MKLYVSNIPYETTEEELSDLFGTVGQVAKVNLVKDRDTGNPRGFGFVEMATEALAQEAIRQLNEAQLGSRRIKVDVAKPRESTGGGGGGGRRFGDQRGPFNGRDEDRDRRRRY